MLGLISTLLLSGLPVSHNANANSCCQASVVESPASTNNSLEAQLAPLVLRRMHEMQVPGVLVGVWERGYRPWIAALGVSNLAAHKPLQLNDKMRIGSITKTFTGTVILQLADEGKLDLDDSVAKYLPGVVPNGEHITIRQLGNMTSGLFNYSEDKTFQKTIFEKNPYKSWEPEELLKIAFQHPPDFAPGKGSHYSNTNTILLGLIVEKITGHSLQDEIYQKITVPLGMQDTTYPSNGGMPNPHAQGYVFDDHANPSAPPLVDVTNWNPSWGGAAGAMISTLEDLHRYAKPLAVGSLLSQKAQSERLTWVETGSKLLFAGRPSRYGFAIADFGGAIGHNGQLPGYQSFMGYDPDKDATIIVLTNLSATRDGKNPADALTQLILTQLRHN